MVTINNEECIITVTRDVTERTIIELALVERETQFRNIFEHTPIGISLIDRLGNLIKVNKFACYMMGYSMEELLSTLSL